MRLFLDTETFNGCDSITAGAYRYAEQAELLLLAYAFDDEPAEVVDIASGEKIPQRLADAFKDESVELWAHNSNFDRLILRKYWPEVGDPKRWKDTMVLARSMAFPASLQGLCGFFGLPEDEAKDRRGKKLIKLFSMPVRNRKTGELRQEFPEDHPADWQIFKDYCRQDVEAMRTCWRMLPKINDTDQLWADFHLDQAINDRGMKMDAELADAAIALGEKVTRENNIKAANLTQGYMATTAQRDRLITVAKEQFGVDLPDAKRTTLEAFSLRDDIPDELRQLIVARLENANASVKKFDAISRSICMDGRLRGCLVFMGAARTGRFAGRLFQPQNISRGHLPADQVEEAIAAIKNRTAYDKYDDPLDVARSCLRGSIIAPAGMKLTVADLSNIEGRTLSGLAGEKWKIEAFRAYDEGLGPDLYKATYARTFGIHPDDVTKPQRQVGKVLELAMGYQGGVGAFVTFARNYGVDLYELAEIAHTTIPVRFLDEATRVLPWFVEKGLTCGLPDKVFIACDAIKRAWRAAHPAIVQFWTDANIGCETMTQKNGSYRCGPVVFGGTGRIGLIRLPSGRFLSYPGFRRSQYGFEYYDNGKYVSTHGGKITENITQAVARDILLCGMHAAEDAGYKVILSVHDELICECPDSPEYTSARLAELMSQTPDWAEGLPLSAAGFEAYRYKKE